MSLCAASASGAGPELWDVFVSYSRTDAPRAGVVVSALRAQGLRVFVDDSDVDDFASISTAITRALSRSKALLALYSVDYPARRACQWELTFAYLTGQREGDPRRRVLVVNPEPTNEHIHPVELRDARHWPWPGTPEAADRLAARAGAYLAQLAEPMGETADAGFVPWLPAPARTGSARFVGRLAEQWQVHSALHRHRAPLIGQSGADRAAQLRGMPGVGKSLLAQEYALRFRPAFPGGVFWFDLHAEPGGRSAERTTERYREQVSTVAAALGVEVPDGPLPRLLSALAVVLGERNEPCLWVVDGLPDGLSAEQLHLLRGPHLLAATLVTTRSLRHTSFAEPVDLAPLPAGDGYRLLASRRAPRTEADRHAAVALVHDVGGHPQALGLLAELATRAGFTSLRSRLHSPGTDVLAAVSGGSLPALPRPESGASGAAEDAHGPGADSGAEGAGSAGAGPRPLGSERPVDDVLRLFALASPAPLSPAVLEQVLSTVHPYAPWEAAGIVDRAVDALLGDGALQPDAHDGSWTVHALLARAVRRHDGDTARQEDLRRALLHALAPPPRTAGENGQRPAPRSDASSVTDTDGWTAAGRRVSDRRKASRGAGPVERAAAFDLQVELVTRVGVQPLADREGSLREALASLHSLFVTAREVLHRINGEVGGGPHGDGIRYEGLGGPAPLLLPAIATGLLARLRPFLSHWHPALEEHEAARPEGVSRPAHERAWDREREMRTALAELREPLAALAGRLGRLSGVDLRDPVDD